MGWDWRGGGGKGGEGRERGGEKHGTGVICAHTDSVIGYVHSAVKYHLNIEIKLTKVKHHLNFEIKIKKKLFG